MGQMGPMGQMGGGMGRMGDSDRLPPLGPARNPTDNYGMMNPVSGPMDGGPFGGRRSFGGDQGGEMSLPMPPLPEFPTSGYGPSRPEASAPPARTRGIRGPVSGPHQGGQNGNGSPTRNRLPEWPANQDAEPPRGRSRGE
ncbi:MAG TPA: hypothetical protein VE338_19255, partial [Ktedonobacterales bacterium]|nr:hypothetical protein [Ktedonobacterales bacterium]